MRLTTSLLLLIARFGPRVILVFVQGAGGKFDAAAAHGRLHTNGTLPAGIIAVFQAHRALIARRCGVDVHEHHVSVGDGEAFAADATAMVAFHHGSLID